MEPAFLLLRCGLRLCRHIHCVHNSYLGRVSVQPRRLGNILQGKVYLSGTSCAVQVMQEVGQEVEGYMTSIFGKDRPDKDAEVVFLTKFIVKPEIALDFIAAIKKVGRGPAAAQRHMPVGAW